MMIETKIVLEYGIQPDSFDKCIYITLPKQDIPIMEYVYKHIHVVGAAANIGYSKGYIFSPEEIDAVNTCDGIIHEDGSYILKREVFNIMMHDLVSTGFTFAEWHQIIDDEMRFLTINKRK